MLDLTRPFAREFSVRTRHQNIQRLQDEGCDLLIIGGGITGAGIAYEAAARGLRVGLLEKNDFASGTSSKSSKMLHGGLRYLQYMEFGLVFEALAQRNRLFKNAPHLAHKLLFLFPIYREYVDELLDHPVFIETGLVLYDLLSSLSDWRHTDFHKRIPWYEVRKYEPGLRTENLKVGYRYMDGSVDDARLTVETLKSAADLGALPVNYATVTSFDKDGAGKIVVVTVKDRISDGEMTIRVRHVVNATGPWADELNRLADPGWHNRLRPTKGIHLIVPRVVNLHAVLVKSKMLHAGKRRWLWALPYGEFSLIGTTDTDHRGDPDDYSYLDRDIYPLPDEVEYLLESIQAEFPGLSLDHSQVISSFGGWRPLIAPPAHKRLSESDISREHEVFETPSGLVTIAGGKLTTYLAMARETVDYLLQRASGDLHRAAGLRTRLDRRPLKGGEIGGMAWQEYLERQLAALKEPTGLPVQRLVNMYGSEIRRVVELAESDLDLRRPIAGLAGSDVYLQAEVAYAVLYEMAFSIQDFMMRRTRLFLKEEHQGQHAVNDVASLMSTLLVGLLGWSEEQRANWIAAETACYQAEVERSNAFKGRCPERAASAERN